MYVLFILFYVIDEDMKSLYETSTGNKCWNIYIDLNAKVFVF